MTGEASAPSSSPPIPDVLDRCAFAPAGTALVCGVSGGADSLALLALAVAAGCRVTAVHVDHGLRPNSSAEAGVVASAAAAVGGEFEAVSSPVARGPNLEARAREVRLEALARVAGGSVPPAQIATGHTLDDRAETILLNLMRGSGPAGVADPLRPGPRHPLTRLRRQETRAVTEAMGWAPVEDPSNCDPAHVRNRLRHEALPLLDEIAGRDVAPLLVRFADLLALDADFLTDIAGHLDPTDARAVAAAPEPVAARALGRWLAAPYPPPLDAVRRALAVARGEALACEVEGGVRVVRSGQRLRRERPAVRGGG